jgi:predicted P-loop ATPase
VPRLDTWLIQYCGVVDNPYVRAVGAKTLIGAVARARRPGCKLDTMLILEGDQGLSKSRLLRSLARGFFRERMPSLDSKDAMIHLLGAWIIEWGELSGLTKHDVQQVKEFLVVQEDHFRAPYDRIGADHPRQCIFIGTTNEDTYLRDDTGNRRFWPVRTTLIRLEEFERVVDQIWAEADARFAAGENWWLEHSLEAVARVEQAARKMEDVWLPDVEKFVADKARVTVQEVLDALGLDVEYRDQRAQGRVVGCLKHLGWQRKQRRTEGDRSWGYERPKAQGVTSDTTPNEEGGDAENPCGTTPFTTSPPVTTTSDELQEEEWSGIGANGNHQRACANGKGPETGGAGGDVVTPTDDLTDSVVL